jgi:hypothetical protein
VAVQPRLESYQVILKAVKTLLHRFHASIHRSHHPAEYRHLVKLRSIPFERWA